MMPVKNDHNSSPKVLEAVSVFLCPLKSTTEMVDSLEERWKHKEGSTLSEENIRLFLDPDWEEEAIDFGKNGRIKATVWPKMACVPNYDWVVLALEATIKVEDFNDLLTFNVGFRRMQGEPEPQDSFFGLDMDDLKLSNGNSAFDVYKRQAQGIVKDYNPLPNLKKSVLLSYAKFERLLNDEELYRFGSVAYPQEPITSEWSEQLKDHIFDRWKSAGWRCFAYSYSLVYALSGQYEGREDDSIKERFLKEYVKMGVAISMQRAWLQEFPRKLRNAQDLKDLRLCHKELVWMQSRFGVRWTPEGTQRMKIEEMWRKASGVDDRMSEVTQLLEQKVDLLEAEATERLNTKTERLNDAVLVLQLIFGLLAGGQVGVAFEPKWLFGPVFAVVGLVSE